MIILLNESGQLGNRLRSLSNLLALSIETNQTIWCPVVPDELKKYINMKVQTKKIPTIYFSYSRIMSLMVKCVSKVGFWKTSPPATHKINIYADWISFAKPELTYKHYDVLAEYFGFREEFVQHCSGLLPQKNNENEIRIAVHLRRNDYKYWNGGKYYYENSVFINQMMSIYRENPNVQFLIFTNDKIEEDEFIGKGFQVHFMNGSAFEDLCTMSMCDYIFGPPSTYSAWAGYIGNKKVAWLRNKSHVYKLNEFERVPESMEKKKQFWELE